jgi:hypothetical protein
MPVYRFGRKDDAMTRSAIIPILSMWGLCVCAPAATAAESGPPTVNSYTPAQAKDASQAATQAGYDPGPVLFAQAGNFFFNASKGGHSYGLTVTPDGKVYASTPLG